MYDYKARMYSPTLGRFMQTDPIGYGDGPNWYNYVGSDPVNFVDPTGLKRQPPSGPPAERDEIVVTAKCDDGEGGGGPKAFPKPTPPQVPGFGWAGPPSRLMKKSGASWVPAYTGGTFRRRLAGDRAGRAPAGGLIGSAASVPSPTMS